jgi:hypothetical protein
MKKTRQKAGKEGQQSSDTNPFYSAMSHKINPARRAKAVWENRAA